ncbi:membrane protein insertase YidC [Candidatus Gottesmanbacteria bacterium]|nr:membrane protein insertase YidC [Candidatus Gottesmanbacteria bacterium]
MENINLWNQLLIWPIVNVLIAFYKLFEWLHVPGPLGFAIILLTVVFRLVLYPLTKVQLASAKKMQNLKPHLDALNAKHKDDKTALQQAQLALYKEHGVNPAAGCLPMLVQLPILIALYNVFYQVLNNGNLEKMIETINKVVYHPALRLTTFDFTFFGINLGIKPNQYQQYGYWLLAIPVVTGLLQWYQSKLMLPVKPSAISDQSSDKKNQRSVIRQEKNTLKAEDGKLKAEPDAVDQSMEMQKQMAMITPIMFGYFALQFPLGLALYWNIFGLFGIIQQLKVNKENK